MMKLEEIFTNPDKLKTLKKVLYGLMVLLIVVDVVTPRHHVHFPWDNLPAFNGFYGFSACVVIIFLARLIGRVVMKREDYYDY